MMRGRNHNQLISMDEHYGQTVVIDGKGNDPEIDGIVDDGLENLGIIGALNVDRHFGVLLLELRENVRQDVEASALVCPDDDLAARNTLHFGDRDHHGFARIERFLNVLEERLSGGSEGDLAAGAVEELGSNLFLNATDLRGDGGLRAEALLCGTGER